MNMIWVVMDKDNKFIGAAKAKYWALKLVEFRYQFYIILSETDTQVKIELGKRFKNEKLFVEQRKLFGGKE